MTTGRAGLHDHAANATRDQTMHDGCIGMHAGHRLIRSRLTPVRWAYRTNPARATGLDGSARTARSEPRRDRCAAVGYHRRTGRSARRTSTRAHEPDHSAALRRRRPRPMSRRSHHPARRHVRTHPEARGPRPAQAGDATAASGGEPSGGGLGLGRAQQPAASAAAPQVRDAAPTPRPTSPARAEHGCAPGCRARARGLASSPRRGSRPSRYGPSSPPRTSPAPAA